jgi:hypothetical protein
MAASRIRTGKDCGFGRFPSNVFAINQAWLELALAGIDLLAWTQHLLLNDELALAEPKNCAIAACTSPPASPEPLDKPGSASPKPGPGQQIWPQPSSASPRFRNQSADTATTIRRHRTEYPDHRVGPSPHPPYGAASGRSTNRIKAMIHR